MWDIIEPHFLEILGLLVTVSIGIATRQISAWTGIQIEEKHRAALHSALMSGATAAMRHGPDAGIDVIKDLAISYARQSVPDAIKALVPGNGVLDALAERYVREAMGRVMP